MNNGNVSKADKQWSTKVSAIKIVNVQIHKRANETKVIKCMLNMASKSTYVFI
jgi:hypothetical protein